MQAMESPSRVLRQELNDGVLVLTFNASNPHNPFSAEMESEVTAALAQARLNDRVRAVVLTGGEARSFSVGGDFNEVKKFQGGPEVEQWLDDVIGMYIACLAVEKPTISALDNFAIGIGFQLALCADYRIGTARCQLDMPELKNGIACVLGHYMLEKMVGRAQMLRMVVECTQVGAHEALRLGLINEVCEPADLVSKARAAALRLAHYPHVAYGGTKRDMNESFIEGLRCVTPAAKSAHRAAFKDQSAQRFMSSIVNG
jgi:enoyl-CoA hydratase/carnithine racemase